MTAGTGGGSGVRRDVLFVSFGVFGVNADLTEKERPESGKPVSTQLHSACERVKLGLTGACVSPILRLQQVKLGQMGLVALLQS